MKSRIAGLLAAVTLGCITVTALPGAASAAPAREQAPFKHAVKVKAKPEKDRVKVGEHVKIKGHLDVDNSGRSIELEDLVVQELNAGVWVDVTTSACVPNGDFDIDLRFDVAATLTLRVFHPETTLNLEASSDVFALVVI